MLCCWVATWLMAAKNLASCAIWSARLCEVAPVFAVGGNHDRHVGMNRVRDAVVGGGGKWIHASSARIVTRRPSDCRFRPRRGVFARG